MDRPLHHYLFFLDPSLTNSPGVFGEIFLSFLSSFYHKIFEHKPSGQKLTLIDQRNNLGEQLAGSKLVPAFPNVSFVTVMCPLLRKSNKQKTSKSTFLQNLPILQSSAFFVPILKNKNLSTGLKRRNYGLADTN